MSTRRHLVTFLSPGTLFAETTTKEVSSWDPVEAMRVGEGIVERHGAKPYGFYFSTDIVAPPVPDGEGGTLNVQPREVDKSGTFFIGGELLSYDDVEAEDKAGISKYTILLSNMEGQFWVVHRGKRSYLTHNPFTEKDVQVDEQGKILERGDSPKWTEYRARKQAEADAAFDERYPGARARLDAGKAAAR